MRKVFAWMSSITVADVRGEQTVNGDPLLQEAQLHQALSLRVLVCIAQQACSSFLIPCRVAPRVWCDLDGIVFCFNSPQWATVSLARGLTSRRHTVETIRLEEVCQAKLSRLCQVSVVRQAGVQDGDWSFAQAYGFRACASGEKQFNFLNTLNVVNHGNVMFLHCRWGICSSKW